MSSHIDVSAQDTVFDSIEQYLRLFKYRMKTDMARSFGETRDGC
jgi:hypothetical protein